MNNLSLWRLTWSHAHGARWLYMRGVSPENAEAWKRVYEQDDGATYTVAAKQPKVRPGDEKRAMHAAIL